DPRRRGARRDPRHALPHPLPHTGRPHPERLAHLGGGAPGAPPPRTLPREITHPMQESRDPGDEVTGVVGAEPAIYGRFGYGLAARHIELNLPRGSALRPFPGSQDIGIRIADFSTEKHGELISDIHRRSGDVGLGRPGWATWETPGLKASRTTLTPALTSGKEPLRILLPAAGEQ